MKDLGHTGDLYIYMSLVIRFLVVKIEHLQVTVDVVIFKSHTNHSVKQLSKFAKEVCLYKLIYKRAFFQVVGAKLFHST